jgi:hypothetical protein
MTKPILLSLLILIVWAHDAFSQQCGYSDLSRKYNYVVSTAKTKNADDGQARVSQIKLQIISKANKRQMQDLTVKPSYLYRNAFSECSAVLSYVTGKNKSAEVEDNDFGDLIVADLNFDGLEDFAVKSDSGGNGGPLYTYFTQNRAGKFREDSYLTERVGYFPATIDARRRVLVTYVHADVSGYNESIFRYNPTTRKWTARKPIYRKAED